MSFLEQIEKPQSLGKMYRFIDTRYSVGDEDYGYSVRVTVNIYIFDIIKKTPKGQWIQNESRGIKPRFVLNHGRKKYAHRTKEEALLSFIARKKKQIRLLEAQLYNVKVALRQVGEKEDERN